MERSRGCVELDRVLPVLVKSQVALADLEAHFSEAQYESAVSMMVAGQLVGSLGDDLHNFLTDTIRNEARVVWEGLADTGDDEVGEYPVNIHEYGGVYFVASVDHEDVGYFLSHDDALRFVWSNWDNVRERNDAGLD